jgi:hypothetical protein
VANSDAPRPSYALAPYFTTLATRYATVLLVIGYMFTTLPWVGFAAFGASAATLTLYVALRDKSEWNGERAVALLLHVVLVVIAGVAALHAAWSLR